MEKLNEGDVLELVIDYLATKGFTQAEQALRKERSGNAALPCQTKNFAHEPRSRLEGLLEKSHVAHMFGTANKRRRTNLDAALLAEEKPAAAAAVADGDAQPEETPATMTMATQITSYNPCKDDPYGASSMPIYQVSTFAQPSATTFGEYDYSRSGNPTRAALEKQICELEEGHKGFAFSSGMAALSAVTRLVKPGQEIILNDDSYGGTYRLLSKVAARNHVIVRYVDMSGPQGPANLSAAISDNTRLIMLESPTNPMQRILDIRAISTIAHAHNAIVELGADIVVHSATKFISGHSDCMAGVVVVKDRALAEQVYFFQNAEGTGLSPFDSWLLLRGVKTMHIRVERQQDNALAVANFLSAHPQVTHVYYTGLPSHPGHDLHMSQASGGGSVICFRTGSLPFSQHIVTHTKLFKITVSFGSVNSLISLPGAMSHASIPAEVRAAREFPEDLIRISVGIESADDLIGDLRRAMAGYGVAAAAAAKATPAVEVGGSGGGGSAAQA
ncbi:cystathionine beta-lyase [Tribonema minus]|uniref:cysteine-S-conjugate beta-lyase n=1 Tax=Tribonema minus TaxID=303371 RepID=A0A835Z2Q6_9STRA|nr:cystathionine beta-lyase [Tribonema minus]